MNNKKTKATANPPASTCACQGIMPILTQLVRRYGPPAETRRHFNAARIEILKGLRAFLDARIEARTAAGAKGEKIDVE